MGSQPSGEGAQRLAAANQDIPVFVAPHRDGLAPSVPAAPDNTNVGQHVQYWQLSDGTLEGYSDDGANYLIRDNTGMIQIIPQWHVSLQADHLDKDCEKAATTRPAQSVRGTNRLTSPSEQTKTLWSPPQAAPQHLEAYVGDFAPPKMSSTPSPTPMFSPAENNEDRPHRRHKTNHTSFFALAALKE